MLASVTNVKEALMALGAGVEMIDLKNPAAGALGALDHALVKNIVQAINHRGAVSATIGDLPMQSKLIVDATQAMLRAGVDIVKIGFFGQSLHEQCLDALHDLATEHKLIAVMFADESPNLKLLDKIAEAGFFGVMLDTAHKNGKHLLNHMSIDQLSLFVKDAKVQGLEVGLAGSIQAIHIETLSQAKPSYLGFRGAICEESKRTSKIDSKKILQLKKQFN